MLVSTILYPRARYMIEEGDIAALWSLFYSMAQSLPLRGANITPHVQGRYKHQRHHFQDGATLIQ